MKFSGLFAAGLAIVGLAACSSDEPGRNDVGDGGVYARVHLQLPTGTRAVTGDFDENTNTNSSDGYEIGQDWENKVNNVTVVLASKQGDGSYGYITHATTSTLSSSANNTFTMQFDVNALNNWAGQQVYVFTYCNVNPQVEGRENNFGDIIANATTRTPWDSKTGENGFIMANAANVVIPNVTLPSLETLRAENSTPATAFDLGTVSVTRVCSRFDYKKATENNVYEIKNKLTGDVEGEIELVAMAPVELATEYYYIPRVSADGTSTSWIYGGAENGNYVVSPNFDLKKATTFSSDLLAKYTSRTTGEGVNLGDASAYNWTTLASWTPDDDNDENWSDVVPEGETFDNKNYKIWTYVPENTIPSVDNQKEGITTGVLFKAKINSVTNTKFSAAMAAKKPVYDYKGTIYGDVEMLRMSAYAAGEKSELYKKFVKVFGADKMVIKTNDDGTPAKGEDGNIVFVNTIGDASSEMNNPVDEEKPVFKIYRPDAEGNYFVYYIYRNRHNDNENAAEMGMMEFGTVRNNVYKLMVTTISDFGYTAVPGDDPDSPGPDNPDEDPDTYFKVSCKVLPWMVRVNNIEF